ncbi:MAG: hypothetical protein HOP19_20915, partial [Acidobacteria bacterium]|nr:hypothetical protein [Acidobacteriota bacterium]
SDALIQGRLPRASHVEVFLGASGLDFRTLGGETLPTELVVEPLVELSAEDREMQEMLKFMSEAGSEAEALLVS